MSRTIVINLLVFVCTASLAQALAGQPRDAKNGGATKTNPDVCALLTSADIQEVQGEPVKDTRPSMQPASGMIISQCLFNTSTFSKSITLALVAPDPAKSSALGPRKLWQQQFHPTGRDTEEKPASKDKDKEPEGEQENELREARSIAAIGDEAYWVGNPVTGALYVLRGEVFMRLSVGGVRDESARIQKSKTLALAVLKRLPGGK